MGTPSPGSTSQSPPPIQPTRVQPRYTPSPPTPPSRLTPVKKRRGGPRLLIFFLLVAAAGVAIYVLLGGRFGILGGGTEEPVAAISAFYSSLDAGKCDDARSVLANPDATAQELCDRWKALKDAGPTTPGAADTVSVSGDNATVAWLRTAGGKPANFTIALRKMNNAWKLTNPSTELLPAP